MLLHKLPHELGRNIISETFTSRPQYTLHWETTLILLSSMLPELIPERLHIVHWFQNGSGNGIPAVEIPKPSHHLEQLTPGPLNSEFLDPPENNK